MPKTKPSEIEKFQEEREVFEQRQDGIRTAEAQIKMSASVKNIDDRLLVELQKCTATLELILIANNKCVLLLEDLKKAKDRDGTFLNTSQK